MKIELTRNDYLYFAYTRLFKVYVLIIGLLSIFRLGFVGYYADKSIYEQHYSDLIYSFFMGWRYDSIVASYLLILPFLAFVFSSLIKSKPFFNFTNWLVGLFSYLGIVLVVVVSICDLGFYSFFQDHLNILFFGVLEDDTEALLKSIWKNYPLKYALIGFSGFLIFLFFILKRTFRFVVRSQKSVLHTGFIKYSLIISLGLVLLFGGARGGYGIMVLSPKYADFSKSLFVNQAALNGLITFEKAIKLRRNRTSLDFNMASVMGYKENIHQAYSDFLGLDVSSTSKEHLVKLLERRTPINEKVEQNKPHVIVILMESFGGHWIKYNSQTFNFMGDLSKYFSEDVFFKNFISSDNGTIGSLMVLGTNIPHREGARFISESRYMQLPLQCAAHIPYKESGYETTFLYGGKLGWRDIGKYFNYQGYRHVEGENHITESLQLSGDQGTEWGLYDEHFFNHIIKKLKNSKRPQFLLGLSTSNHPPFKVPNTFKAPKLVLPQELESKITREKDLFLLRFKGFQYANYQLAKFIKKIKESDLGQNTIIAVTGDHNFWGFMNYAKEEAFVKYSVPFYMHIPDDLKPNKENIDLNKFGSHEDIMPTLYNISLSEKPFVAFGEDLFSFGKSISMNGGIYAGDSGVVLGNKSYAWGDNQLILLDGKKQDLKDLRQQYRSTLTVADHYLRVLYQNSKIDNKSGQ